MELASQERHTLLKKLAAELIKENPKQSFVKECMEQMGMAYAEDPILCINSVLTALHFEEPKKEILEEPRQEVRPK